jgi:hypothetical protein
MPDDELRIEYVSLAELVHWPRNPKDHDLGALSQSFARFGYVNPILIDEGSGRMVAGHGRVDLLWHLRNQGQSAPERVRVGADGEWAVPVIRGIRFRNESEAEAYLVADNQLVVLGGWHDNDLYDMLKRHLETDTLDGMGFNAEDVQELHERLLAQAQGLDDENVEAAEETPATFDVFTRESIIAVAFDHFRKSGFPYRRIPVHTQMIELNRLAALKDDPRALKSNLGYLIADSYHPHRFECHAQEKRSPVDSFDDDDQLRRALGLALDNGQQIGEGFFSMLTLVAGTQACSNFRPGIALHFYRRYGRVGGLVLDPCTGYGGRLVGWMASGLGGQYIGVDPSRLTHDGNEQMATALARPLGLTVDLFNVPFEDVDTANLVESVDCIVTSPPYFAKELYAQEPTQSFQRYRTIEEWENGFLRPMLAGCFRVLRPGAFACVNIADVKLGQRVFPLEEMTRHAAHDAGFQLSATEQLEFSPHFGQGQQDEEVKTEPMFIFRKADVDAPAARRIGGQELQAMFERSGITKDALYTALRTMGREHVKGAALKAEWTPDNPTRNYCYVIAEFVFRFLAPAGSTAYRLDIAGDTAQHYFVRWPDGSLVDLAAEQFPDYYQQVQYDRAVRANFMPPSPSRRAVLLAQHLGLEASS